LCQKHTTKFTGTDHANANGVPVSLALLKFAKKVHATGSGVSFYGICFVKN
jgi:hypothetical protein